MPSFKPDNRSSHLVDWTSLGPSSRNFHLLITNQGKYYRIYNLSELVKCRAWNNILVLRPQKYIIKLMTTFSDTMVVSGGRREYEYESDSESESESELI